MEEERRVLEEAIRVSSQKKARAEAMRVERKGKVESKQWDSEEEAAWMEAKKRAVAMKHPLGFSFRFCPINFSLKFSFILSKIDFSLEFSFRLTFPISDWLQIALRFI